jgi:pSer/pThr/pTyr-binding forkhead associated (FHA) protein
MNGTQLNGHPLEPNTEFYVQDGDLVRFGDADFAYLTAKSLFERLHR